MSTAGARVYWFKREHNGRGARTAHAVTGPGRVAVCGRSFGGAALESYAGHGEVCRSCVKLAGEPVAR